MVVNMYAVRDVVAGETGPIFLAKNDAIALRQTNHMLQNEGVSNVDDFQLWHVGEYDTELMDVQKNLFEVVIPRVKDVEDEQDIQ